MKEPCSVGRKMVSSFVYLNILLFLCSERIYLWLMKKNVQSSISIVDNIKELKRKVLPDDKLILFGSQARQEATFESDWDMLILLDKDEITPTDFEKYAYPFVELGWKLGEYFSMKLYTVSEWMKRKGTPFFKNVETEGIEL